MDIEGILSPITDVSYSSNELGTHIKIKFKKILINLNLISRPVFNTY